MGDQRLRELDRRRRETGRAEDAAAWLAERLRAGELARDRLELAAACGDAGARRALGPDAPARLHTASAYELLPRGVECLVIGLAEPFPRLLEVISVDYLRDAWKLAASTLELVGLPAEPLAHGGSSGDLWPSPGLEDSPATGFGWAGLLSPEPDLLRALCAALVGESPPLFAAVARQRVFRSREAPSPRASLVAFAEWCLEEEAWPAGLTAQSPFGARLVTLAAEHAKARRSRAPASPFAQLGQRPLLPELARWALD